MTNASATTDRRLSADEAFAEIERHKVALTPALNGKLWSASCVLLSARRSGRPVERMVTGIASSPLLAIERLLLGLAAEPVERKLFDEMMIDE